MTKKFHSYLLKRKFFVPEVATPGIETKTKRRPHLLKRKAITTSFFDTNRGKDKGYYYYYTITPLSHHIVMLITIIIIIIEPTNPTNTGTTTGGMVFGVPLSQCIENERLTRNSSCSNVMMSFKNKNLTFPYDSDTELKKKTYHGSRTSFSSLIEPRPQDEVSFILRRHMVSHDREIGRAHV